MGWAGGRRGWRGLGLGGVIDFIPSGLQILAFPIRLCWLLLDGWRLTTQIKTSTIYFMIYFRFISCGIYQVTLRTKLLRLWLLRLLASRAERLR